MTTETGGRDAYVSLHGLRFLYLEWGASDAPPLVILHRLTGLARAWTRFAGEVADHFRVLALDRRGHGANVLKLPLQSVP
jgi:pimeloyl-ACP methyl ester carboxylesterase